MEMWRNYTFLPKLEKMGQRPTKLPYVKPEDRKPIHVMESGLIQAPLEKNNEQSFHDDRRMSKAEYERKDDRRPGRDQTPSAGPSSRSASRDSTATNNGYSRDEIEELKKQARSNDPKMKETVDKNYVIGGVQHCGNCHLCHSIFKCPEPIDVERLRFKPSDRTRGTLLRSRETGTLTSKKEYAAKNPNRGNPKNSRR